MKYRAVLLLVVPLGIYAETQVARANPPTPPASHPNWDSQNQGFLGPRVGGDSWNAPAATVNPGSLIPDDSTNSASLDRTAHPSFGPKSFQLMNALKGNQKDFDGAKPIEKVETHSEALMDAPPPPTVAPPKRGSHRVAIIALISVALLAFRKFRRVNTGVHPRKPSFL